MDKVWLEERVAKLLRLNDLEVSVEKLEDDLIKIKLVSSKWPENTIRRRYFYAEEALKGEAWFTDNLVILKCFTIKNGQETV